MKAAEARSKSTLHKAKPSQEYRDNQHADDEADQGTRVLTLAFTGEEHYLAGTDTDATGSFSDCGYGRCGMHRERIVSGRIAALIRAAARKGGLGVGGAGVLTVLW